MLLLGVLGLLDLAIKDYFSAKIEGLAELKEDFISGNFVYNIKQ